MALCHHDEIRAKADMNLLSNAARGFEKLKESPLPRKIALA